MPFLLAFVPLCGYVCVGLGLLASWVGRIPVKRLCTWHTDGFTLTLAFYPNLLTHRSSVYLIRAGCKPCSSERAGNCPTWHTKASPSSSGHHHRPSEPIRLGKVQSSFSHYFHFPIEDDRRWWWWRPKSIMVASWYVGSSRNYVDWNGGRSRQSPRSIHISKMKIYEGWGLGFEMIKNGST